MHSERDSVLKRSCAEKWLAFRLIAVSRCHSADTAIQRITSYRRITDKEMEASCYFTLVILFPLISDQIYAL
jgi:hypothetical protein